MCFWYCITKKNPTKLVKNQIINEKQLYLIDDIYLASGFERPVLPVISNDKPDEIQFFQWGFIPKGLKINYNEFLSKYNTLNAKSETILESRLYCDAVRNQRCLVLCTGFFEWKSIKIKGKKKKEKIPYYISLKDDEMFVFAGIWNEYTDSSSGEIIKTYSVITTQANKLIAEIHNTKKRMPVILEPEKSEIAGKLNLKKKGNFAIKTR